MRRSRLLPLLGLMACGSTPAEDGDLRFRIRLEQHDPLLYDVAAVDLDLRRDQVVVRERLAAASGQFLSFPVEVIVKIPIGPGALQIEASARGPTGQTVGGGDGRVTAERGTIATATVGLFTERHRPFRSRIGAGSDAGAPEDAAPVGPPDAAIPDAAPAPDVAGVPADVAAGPCTPRTRQLPARAVISVDYGTPPPRDGEETTVAVSSGFAHDHVHDFVGWIRFELGAVPGGARLVSAKLSLVLTRSTMSLPPLAILYSASDGWDPATLTSDQAELVARTARVSGDLGLPRNGRADYTVDAELYRPFFTRDLADGAVTLGMVSTTAAMAPQTWADFYGLQPADLAPRLVLETCE